MKKIKTKKGFSLMELVIAMAIFSIIMTAVLTVFVGIFSSYNKSKALNKNLQNAQQAMNLLAKSLRTSSILKCSNGGTLLDCSEGESYSTIRVFDYSQERLTEGCIEYKFDTSASVRSLQYRSSGGNKEDCYNSVSLGGSYQKIIDGIINSGRFLVVPSAESSKVGKVTVNMEVISKSGNQSDTVNIQSSLSLRDYAESKL